jgi:hypothetical protein
MWRSTFKDQSQTARPRFAGADAGEAQIEEIGGLRLLGEKPELGKERDQLGHVGPSGLAV